MAEYWGNEMRLVRIEDLRHCLIAAFEQLELPHEDAEQVAEVLLDSELRGHESHGVHLLGFLADAYRSGMNPRPASECCGRRRERGTTGKSVPIHPRAWKVNSQK